MVKHCLPLKPTSIVFTFLISNRPEIFFGASWALWATLKLIKRVFNFFWILEKGGSSVFWRKWTLWPKLSTKDEANFFFWYKNKKLISMVKHCLPLKPTSIVFSFLISHRHEKFWVPPEHCGQL
jgi:hypothetical protein